MVDIVKGLFEIDEIDIQWAVSFRSLLYDVSQCKYLISPSSSLPESRFFLPQLLVDTCLDSAKEDSTENIAGMDKGVIPRQLSQT